MNVKKVFSLSSFTCLVLLLGFNTSQAANIADPVGTYEITVSDIPDQGDIKGTMVVSKKDGAIQVKFASPAGEMDLKKAKLEGNKLTGEISAQGYTLALSGNFENDTFKGEFSIEYENMSINIVGKKKK